MNKKFNPQMLKLARYARKLTQSALAKELGVKPPFISQIEAGVADIPVELFSKIIKKLDFPEKFFYQEAVFLEGCSKLYRAKKTFASKERDYIDTYASFFNKHISKLLEGSSIDKDEFKLIEIRPHEYKTPEQIAIAVREYWNIPRGPINNLTEILENLGIFIIPIQVNNSDFDATYYINEKNDFALILINSNVTPDRYRFNLAHELGHLIMHRIPVPDCEEQAHEFAGAFLMPKKDIESDLAGLSFWDLPDLKKQWKVSMQAIVMRAKKLKKLNKEQTERIYKQFSYHGFRKEEPICDIPKENPMMLKYLINYFKNDLEYTNEQLCEYLCISISEYNRMYGKLLDDYIVQPKLRLIN